MWVLEQDSTVLRGVVGATAIGRSTHVTVYVDGFQNLFDVQKRYVFRSERDAQAAAQRGSETE